MFLIPIKSPIRKNGIIVNLRSVFFIVFKWGNCAFSPVYYTIFVTSRIWYKIEPPFHLMLAMTSIVTVIVVL